MTEKKRQPSTKEIELRYTFLRNTIMNIHRSMGREIANIFCDSIGDDKEYLKKSLVYFCEKHGSALAPTISMLKQTFGAANSTVIPIYLKNERLAAGYTIDDFIDKIVEEQLQKYSVSEYSRLILVHRLDDNGKYNIYRPRIGDEALGTQMEKKLLAVNPKFGSNLKETQKKLDKAIKARNTWEGHPTDAEKEKRIKDISIFSNTMDSLKTFLDQIKDGIPAEKYREMADAIAEGKRRGTCPPLTMAKLQEELPNDLLFPNFQGFFSDGYVEETQTFYYYSLDDIKAKLVAQAEETKAKNSEQVNVLLGDAIQSGAFAEKIGDAAKETFQQIADGLNNKVNDLYELMNKFQQIAEANTQATQTTTPASISPAVTQPEPDTEQSAAATEPASKEQPAPAVDPSNPGPLMQPEALSFKTITGIDNRKSGTLTPNDIMKMSNSAYTFVLGGFFHQDDFASTLSGLINAGCENLFTDIGNVYYNYAQAIQGDQHGKKVRNFMSLAHGNNVLNYVDMHRKPGDEEIDILLQLAEENPDTLFSFVISQTDSRAIKKVREQNPANVLVIRKKPQKDPTAVSFVKVSVAPFGKAKDKQPVSIKALTPKTKKIKPTLVPSKNASNTVSLTNESSSAPAKAPAEKPVEKKAEEKTVKLKKTTVNTKPAVPISTVCIPEDGTLIGVEKLPTTDDTLTDDDKNSIKLGSKIAEGGEGVIYSIVGNEKLVAKIYWKERLTVNRQKKLELMIQKVKEMSANNERIDQVCWPESCLRYDGQFVGYTMKRIPSDYQEAVSNVLALLKPSIRDLYPNISRKHLVKLCRNLCNVFGRIQRMGLLIGDINARNILIKMKPDSNDNLPFVIVDTDSWQVGPYPCPVGTVQYTNPDIYTRITERPLNYGKFLRTAADENFAIASLMFSILMLNASPYGGKGEIDIEDAIKNRRFSYRLTGKDGEVLVSGADTPDGPFRLMWNNIPYYIKDLFALEFFSQGEITPEQWAKQFSMYFKQIVSEKYTDELIPVLYFTGGHDDEFVMYNCDACGAERNMPAARYKHQNEINYPHLCQDCQAVFDELKNEVAHCSQCGAVMPNITKQFEKVCAFRGSPLLCGSCRAKSRPSRSYVKRYR